MAFGRRFASPSCTGAPLTSEPVSCEQHNVIRTKQAKTRDELLDLMARNYYGARDTTWTYWSDNQIRHWLEKRGLLNKVKEPSRREQLEEAISDRYFDARDAAYSVGVYSLHSIIEQRTDCKMLVLRLGMKVC